LKLGGELHLVESLAITFRMGAAKQALVAFLKGVPLLLADKEDAMIADAGEAGANGPVVANCAVAVQLNELVEDHVDVIDGLRAVRMARNQTRVPGGEIVVDFAD